MANQRIISKTQKFGGWTEFRPLTKRDQRILNEASKGIIEGDYTPLEVSIQIVNGINYRFKCSVSLPPTKIIYKTTVEIYEPIGDKSRITVSQKAHCNSAKTTIKKMPNDQPLTADERASFEAAISAIVGITYGLN
ncbi:MAG: hypothetical protein HRT57_12795 [Crocinitomicaceae bacterium]|nr:hypothetical protein [Crocinitomicaceae bacterium]